MTKDNAKKPSKTIGGEVEWVRVDTLSIDPEYQRPVSEPVVRGIINEFDPDAVGVLLVSERHDGTRVLLDGQQRQAAFLRMGWGDQMVPCMIYRGLREDQEAKLFIKYNADRGSVGPVHLFKSRVKSGEIQAMSIKNVLDKHGVKVTTSQAPGNCSAIGTLDTIYLVGGAPLLDWSVRMASRAFPREKRTYSRPVLGGLAVFHRTYPRASESLLEQKLTKKGLTAVLQQAKGIQAAVGGNYATTTAHAMVLTYNLRTREEAKLDASLIPPKFTKSGFGHTETPSQKKKRENRKLAVREAGRR